MIIAQYLDKQTGREATVTWNVKRHSYAVTVYNIDDGRYEDGVLRFTDRAKAEATARTVIEAAG